MPMPTIGLMNANPFSITTSVNEEVTRLDDFCLALAD